MPLFHLVNGFSELIDVHLFCGASKKTYAARAFAVATTFDGMRKVKLFVARDKGSTIELTINSEIGTLCCLIGH